MFRLILLFLFGYVALRIFEENKPAVPDGFDLPDNETRPAKRGAGRRAGRPATPPADNAAARDRDRGTDPDASTNA
jgi:hypothetical protein